MSCPGTHLGHTRGLVDAYIIGRTPPDFSDYSHPRAPLPSAPMKSVLNWNDCSRPWSSLFWP